MKIFDIVDNKIVVSPEVLEVPEFKAIWEADKDKKKTNAFNDFKYIKFICDPDGPYSSIEYTRRVPIILMDTYGNDKKKVSKEVEIGLAKYKELTETPLQRLVKAVKFKIDDFAVYLMTTPITPDTEKSIMDIISKISLTIASFDKVQEAVEKEKLNSNEKRRGGKKNNKYED